MRERRRQLSGDISVECGDEEGLARRSRGCHYSHEIALETNHHGFLKHKTAGSCTASQQKITTELPTP